MQAPNLSGCLKFDRKLKLTKIGPHLLHHMTYSEYLSKQGSEPTQELNKWTLRHTKNFPTDYRKGKLNMQHTVVSPFQHFRNLCKKKCSNTKKKHPQQTKNPKNKKKTQICSKHIPKIRNIKIKISHAIPLCHASSS